MKHPNLYNDNIVATHTGRNGTHIHIDNGAMGHAIIRTHGPDGELLPGEKNTKNPKRDVIATGQPKYIQKMFNQINESEEIELDQSQLSELSTATLGSYINKAQSNRDSHKKNVIDKLKASKDSERQGDRASDASWMKSHTAAVHHDAGKEATGKEKIAHATAYANAKKYMADKDAEAEAHWAKSHEQRADAEKSRDIVRKRNAGIKTAANKILNKEEVELTQEDLDSMLEYIDTLESELGINESVENPIIEMIDNLMSGELHESNSLFYDLIGFKLNEKIELKKIEVAQSIMGGVVESHDEDEDDNKSDEVGEDEESKHPLVQLNKIADHKPLTDDEALEKKADGSFDERSLRALNDRKAKGGSTSSKPLFLHKNGETSDISPEHAQHIVNILSGSSLKPHIKKQVMDAIHGSKAGFEKVKGLLLATKPKEKSIYGQDSRTA